MIMKLKSWILQKRSSLRNIFEEDLKELVIKDRNLSILVLERESALVKPIYCRVEYFLNMREFLECLDIIVVPPRARRIRRAVGEQDDSRILEWEVFPNPRTINRMVERQEKLLAEQWSTL